MINNLLIIGIDNYQKITKLNNCVRDLENIVDLLVDKYDFEKDKVKRLYDSEATQENIINTLEDFYASQSSGENLIIFYSGHGEFDNKLDLGYFLPVDTMLYNKASYLPNSTVFNYIKAFEYRHVVLISDSCFSGSLFSTTRSIESSSERLYEIPSKWALTSGRIEKVSDGIPGGNSPFATSILKNLNEYNRVSISELTQNVIRDVADNNKQIPRGAPLQMFGDKGGEFVFKPKSKSSVVHYSKIVDIAENEELKNLFTQYYDIADQLEEAENQKKSATVRRLEEEVNFIENAIYRELIKILELEKSRVLVSKKIQKILGTNLDQKYKELKKLNEDKTIVVRRQQFDKALELREEEKKLQAEMFQIIMSKMREIVDIIASEENQIARDFGILSILTDIAPSNNKAPVRKNIDKEFSNILFIKLSKDYGKISQIRFKEKYLDFQHRVVPQIVSDITTDKANDEVKISPLRGLRKMKNIYIDNPSELKKTAYSIPKKKK